MTRPPLEFEVLASDAELAAFEPAWHELFVASGTHNPFAHPSWLLPWLREFVPAAERRRVLAVRRAGELVGVAPFYYRRVGRCLTIQLAGSPAEEDLTEMSEVLVAPDDPRHVLQAVVEELALVHAHGCDWIGITMPPEQGWFYDEWIPSVWRRKGAFSMHKSVRPFSILPLAASYEDVPLKRNVRNHIRRAENRHARLEESVEIRFAEGSDVAEAAASVRQLHRDRAARQVGVVHSDYFCDDRVGRLALDGLGGLAGRGDAYVALCEIGGRPVAGRVVLRAGGRSFLSYSGFDTGRWRLSSPTLLLSAVIERAIADGDRALNLSLNPDSAKQRWTERVELHNEFVLVGPARRSRALFALFWQARSAGALRDKRASAARERAHGESE